MNKSITTYSSRRVMGAWRSVTYSLLLFTLSASLTACSDTISSFFGDGEIEQGEAVVFNTMVPDVSPATRSAKSEWQEKVGAYKAVEREYTFTVEMWKQGDDAYTATSTYKPIYTDENGNITYNDDGTLQAAESATPLYWQDNVNPWGFKAYTTNTDVIAADQSDQTKWLAQDKLIGYSYLPIWTGTDKEGHETDNINGINYRTSKEWYRDNKTAKELSGLMVSSSEDYKKIPLYLQHQRAWVTVILKAGEGVTREALAYATSGDNITTSIYSYREGQIAPDAITGAWSSEYLIDYDNDKNGDAANNVSTTRYDAIVEPHNFIKDQTSAENDIIARISVSNQNFSFAAANDMNYGKSIAVSTEPAVEAEIEMAKEKMKVYDLEAGKHLTIVATLSRASRMILITAWIEDWTETVTQTICDDYGQNGDPILINNRWELDQFLKSKEMNKPGNVGLIVPNAMSLVDSAWVCGEHDLKATLNLAGAKLTTDKQFLGTIERTGSLVNGEIIISDGFNGATSVATKNEGTIERVRVTTSSELTTARASRAGIVVDNYGTIFQCTSALPVYGSEAYYVGGIAATNQLSSDGGTQPTIESCTVTARVDGNASVTAGGGIVGLADGHISNNTFDYGVTLLQNQKFRNIVGDIGSHGLTTHTNNSWPTTESYEIGSTTIVNARVGQKYHAVIDNQDELKTLLTSAYNNNASIYRIAKSFTLNKDKDDSNWIWGNAVLSGGSDGYFSVLGETTDYARGEVRFTLDGNDKTITLTGTSNATMLFGNILGRVYDLNLLLDKPIIANRILKEGGVDSNTDAIAAFAYDVMGTGMISNISLKANNTATDYIQATTPGGIAVWASNGGTITRCVSNVHIKMNVVFAAGVVSTEGRRYAGGIVACAEKATITQCKYYGGSGSIGWVADNQHCQKDNCRYGGIVGGTSEISGSGDRHPSLVLSDCSSWYVLPTFSDDVTPENRPRMGSLIGSTVYHDPGDATKLFSAMADGNAGNWWEGTVGAGYLMTGVKEDKAIGKKNSVVPKKPTGW